MKNLFAGLLIAAACLRAHAAQITAANVTNIVTATTGATAVNRGIKTATNYGIIVVSGSGVSAVNGNYVQKVTNSAGSGTATWTNSVNTNYTLLYNDAEVALIPLWSLQNKALGKFYYDNLLVTSPFASYEDTGDGPAPMPVVTPLFTYTTNLIAGSVELATNSTIYVDPVAGNDDTAIRGVPSRPFKDLVTATYASRSGDTFFLYPGVHDMGYRIWTPTNAIVLAECAQIFSKQANGGILIPRGTFQMFGGTVSNTLSTTDFDSAGAALEISYSSNIFMNNTKLSGARQVVKGIVGTGWSGIFSGCYIDSGGDGFNVSANGNQTNSLCSLIGCTFLSENRGYITGGSAQPLRAISFGELPVFISGCVIKVVNATNNTGNAVNPSCGIEASGSSGNVYVSGTAIDCPTTNTASRSIYKIVQSGTGKVRIAGAAYNPGDVLGTVIYEGSSTNISSYTITTNDFALNTFYTNVAQRSYVASSFSLAAPVATFAKVSLYLDQGGGGTFTQALPIQDSGGSATTNILQVGAFLQPSARFAFSNLSTGVGATAAIVAGSSQWTKQ